ncbi:hypothetical protein PILCRDRAFT_824502 [Piloderma croceum F 1598]|uniref:Uncharacterized protein n=1 Tax=Piloderma croceum (strain F 1598) TaxID=765440 RepID=A0A0C3FEB5_PILCF|nr:hypothetical protein PILCRDRAFT_824502 [Piloderma croceum F 1598]
MQSTRLRILSVSSTRQYQGRLLHTTSRFNSTFKTNGKDSSLSQGHVANPSQSAQRDPQSQWALAGQDQNKNRGSKSSSQMDAASRNSVPKAPGAGKGNPEQVGFVDQVGSASASGNPNTGARGSKKNGSEEAASPGFFNTLKKMLGFKTSYKEVKPGGTGVTRTASTPPDSTRYVGRRRENGKEKGTHTADMATDTSRMLKKKPLLGDQNEHLTHKKEGNRDSGKGNAAEEPVLPSQRRARKSEGEDEAKRFPSGARG